MTTSIASDFALWRPTRPPVRTRHLLEQRYAQQTGNVVFALITLFIDILSIGLVIPILPG